MSKVNVLILGEENWIMGYAFPENISLTYKACLETEIQVEGFWDLIILDRDLRKGEFKVLHRIVAPYCLMISEGVSESEEIQRLCEQKKGRRLSKQELISFLYYDARNFVRGHYGRKGKMTNVGIAHKYQGLVQWNGNRSIELRGDFGEEWQQCLFWKDMVRLPKGQCLEIWLEYQKEEEVSIELSIRQYRKGKSQDEVQDQANVGEDTLQQVVYFENWGEEGELFFSLRAKGKGMLRIIALHWRASRRGYGEFLPGGERYVTSEREEFFCYFDPGDLKPPLNVYFCPYRKHEGFRDVELMRKMGNPFLLISDVRLEGGAFYMGSSEYEALLGTVIRKRMEELHFTSEDVIFSGISMGAFGALYYGSDIVPHGLVLGKPIVSLEAVAQNEKLNRPGEFATALDILNFHTQDEKNEREIQERFWSKFDYADWGMSKFLISYMVEDDYDPRAYEQILDHLSSEGVQVVGKAFHGRNRDCSEELKEWFQNQLKKILAEDYQR